MGKNVTLFYSAISIAYLLCIVHAFKSACEEEADAEGPAAGVAL